MKNPFKKADSAKLPEQGRERTEIDYAHRTIIHHMLYGYPGDFSSCASYPEYDTQRCSRACWTGCRCGQKVGP